MQCQDMVMDSTIFARQQPRYIDGDKTREERLSTPQQAWTFSSPLTVKYLFSVSVGWVSHPYDLMFDANIFEPYWEQAHVVVCSPAQFIYCKIQQ